ncbi:MAG: 2OG-Fe(II) oxygenase [Sphingomonadales bacterium]|nr:2OG-Fe(II) oxygenase [Sphingomonadales bacterium]MBK9430957.1 2OG-Fe(II) oxygenase [Sphingomonadales bacterium]MBL0021105.1 2OG-Fe(II) oxygenase [Sphingomonadales bacterium]
MPFRFQINTSLDPAKLSQQFVDRGYISIPGFLAGEGARALKTALAQRSDWHWAISADGNVYDLPPETRAAMTEAQCEELDRRIYAAARDKFQFRFSSVRVPDPVADRQPETDILHAFAEFMRSEAVMAFLRIVAGRAAIRFADAQATAYHPGDFLTGHDDDVEGKSRELAYVMGLTENWRVEWGGLLLFHGSDGQVNGLVPRFNCLNMFALPVMHSVSQVTPFAGEVRHTVTGWLRTAIPS